MADLSPDDAPLDVLRQPLERLLAQLRGEDLFLWSNPGNAGDALIRVAARQAIERADLQVVEISPDGDVAGGTALVIGGGNLVPYYDEVDRAFVQLREGGAGRIIVLPHTIRGTPSTLTVAEPGDVIMCRDTVSVEVVRRSGCRAPTVLAHDVAFHLDAGDFLSDPELSRIAEPALAHSDASRHLDQGIVLLTRTDCERGAASPSSDVDISSLFGFGGGRTATSVSAWCFLTFISRCRSIVTDRLHVAIGSALVGTECVLLPNSYDKNEAVYRHSLSRFANVTFQGQWSQ
ncbi:MAG: hypothetical protein RLZ55_1014 [Actinomycetota bacterium]|jgi:exopolysaccharide biosynthesis predicted pyruvyltransferase EpsI